MPVTDIGYALAGATGLGIIVIGARLLFAPAAAAAGFGIAVRPDDGNAGVTAGVLLATAVLLLA
jgi:hypothetical protein